MLLSLNSARLNKSLFTKAILPSSLLYSYITLLSLSMSLSSSGVTKHWIFCYTVSYLYFESMSMVITSTVGDYFYLYYYYDAVVLHLALLRASS